MRSVEIFRKRLRSQAFAVSAHGTIPSMVLYEAGEKAVTILRLLACLACLLLDDLPPEGQRAPCHKMKRLLDYSALYKNDGKRSASLYGFVFCRNYQSRFSVCVNYR